MTVRKQPQRGEASSLRSQSRQGTAEPGLIPQQDQYSPDAKSVSSDMSLSGQPRRLKIVVY